jgi:hypothetical protein
MQTLNLWSSFSITAGECCPMFLKVFDCYQFCFTKDVPLLNILWCLNQPYHILILGIVEIITLVYVAGHVNT